MTSGPGSTSGSKLPQLLVSVLLLGIADSMIGPYLVLFGPDEPQLSPLQVGVFISVIAVSGLAVSAWLGRRYDQSASRAPAFIALAAPAVGYLALTTTTRYALLLLIAAAFLGAGMAAFPQLFTLARTHLDLSAGAATRRGTPPLRSVWSLAWAVGPPDRCGRAGLAGLPRAAGAHRPGLRAGRGAVAAARCDPGHALAPGDGRSQHPVDPADAAGGGQLHAVPHRDAGRL